MEKTFKQRQSRLLKEMPSAVDAFLVTGLSSIRYLCGFTGSAGCLLLDRRKSVFFTDFRYQEQSAQEIRKSAEIVVFKTSSMEAVGEYLTTCPVKVLGIEGSLAVEQLETLKKTLRNEIRILNQIPEQIRWCKDEKEIKALRKVFQISDKAFARIVKFIKPGRKEIDIAAKLEFILRKSGSEGPSFSTIVASGERAACPHAQPTKKKIESGEMLKIDFGATFDGYRSDMTRTVFLGKATPRFKEIYGIVLEAQRRAIAAIKPGVPCKDVDAAARDYIASKGFGENFGHGTGHALGLDVHEPPRLSAKSSEVLAEGMVVTVEPGIYIPGWGGVRIEDVFVVRSSGPERLTHTPNELLEIL